MSKAIINANRSKGVINKNIYGHFSEHLGRCIYDGIYVGKDSEIPNENGMRTDAVNALKAMKLPMLRWPGGCFADTYHWRDGIGPLKDRKKIVNTSWGGITEDNSFGTHEFLELCRQYATYLRNYSREYPIYKIASGASNDDYHWNQVVMEKAGQYIDAVSLHYYTIPNTEDWAHKGSATDFTRDEYYKTMLHALRMDEMVENHSNIIRCYQGKRKVGLAVDEWGTWLDVEPGTNPSFLYQQNTMRDAMVAAVTLNIFNNHCDTVVMANIAQLVNVLQAVILTEGEKMVLTPTYHIFEMYKGHQDAKQLESYVETALIGETEEGKVPDLHISASQAENGSVLVTVANLNDEKSASLDCTLAGIGKIEKA